jgi:hypothetical protein
LAATSAGTVFCSMMREVRLDDEPAVEAGDRRIELERIEQHGHAHGRPAAGDGEADAGLAQALHGGLGAPWSAPSLR